MTMISRVEPTEAVRKQKLIKKFVNEHNGSLILSRLISQHRKCREKWEVAHRTSHGLYFTFQLT